MRAPTPEQEAVLGCTGRVRLVRAAPGSGKTWLVAEAIRRELDRWDDRSAGIAALSFTRVAGEEIKTAIGRDLPHPHYVGTLDAFLYRYVVRPHLRGVYPQFAAPKLIPGDWAPASIWTTLGADRGLSAFACMWTDRASNGEPVLMYSNRHQLRALHADERDRVLKSKRYLWEVSGLLTHSDVAYLAAKILRHSVHGRAICAALVRRFPLIVVDELQDTGWFLGSSIIALLSQTSGRGLLVGDPDQAVYEFNGARPALFDEFHTVPGVTLLTLATSMRCPARVAAAASMLKSSGGTLSPIRATCGRTILVAYESLERDVPRIVAAVRAGRVGAIIKVIARHAKTVDILTGRANEEPPNLHCRPTFLLQRAVQSFRRDKLTQALAATRAAAGQVVYGREGLTDEVLSELGAEPAAWKQLAILCLLAMSELPTSTSSLEWQMAAGKLLIEQATAYCAVAGRTPVLSTLKPQRREGHDRPAGDFIRVAQIALGSDRVHAQTVHSVKGETHDVTVLVCPPAPRAPGCPSHAWWPPAGDSEDRRIAYVAMTRSRSDFVLCVHSGTFQRLLAQRPEFVSLFDTPDLDALTDKVFGAAVATIA